MVSGLQCIVGRDGNGKNECASASSSSRTPLPRLRALTASSTSSSSSLPPSLKPSASWLSSSDRLRCKFLYKIGISDPMIATNCRLKLPQNRFASVAERSRRDFRFVPQFNTTLQYANDAHEKRVTQREPSYSSKVKKRVDFDTSVTVVPIPMRSDYSDRIKSKLWWNKLELCDSVDRNMTEFAAEDYNWRNTCPEEEMYYCMETKELVHPVHIELGRYSFGTGGRVYKAYINGQYCC